MSDNRHIGPKRRPLFDVSSVIRGSPESAWDIAAQLIGNRQRGAVIERDPRAHEALRLLGGRAAYDLVDAAPEHIRPQFLRVYALLSEIANLMVELEAVVAGREPPGVPSRPIDSSS